MYKSNPDLKCEITFDEWRRRKALINPRIEQLRRELDRLTSAKEALVEDVPFSLPVQEFDLWLKEGGFWWWR